MKFAQAAILLVSLYDMPQDTPPDFSGGLYCDTPAQAEMVYRGTFELKMPVSSMVRDFNGVVGHTACNYYDGVDAVYNTPLHLVGTFRVAEKTFAIMEVRVYGVRLVYQNKEEYTKLDPAIVQYTVTVSIFE